MKSGQPRVAFLALTLLLAGCSGEDGKTPPGGGTSPVAVSPTPLSGPEEPARRTGTAEPAGQQGRLVLSVTDAPFPREHVRAVLVTFGAIRGRVEESTALADGWHELSNELRTIDLLPLHDGIKAELLGADVPPGLWSELRIVLESARIELVDGRSFDLKVPSGDTSGLKVKPEPAVRVVGGLSVELVLDFDLERSFVVQGDPETAAGIKGFIFKPVLEPINASTGGRVLGVVR